MRGLLINGIESGYVSVQDRGLHYGDGVFETIACDAGRAQFASQHLDRLQRGAQVLGIAFPGRQLFLDDIERLLQRSSGAGVVKLILTRGRGKRGYRSEQNHLPTRICMLSDRPAYIDRWQREGITARFCATPVSVNPQLAGLKTLNRLENVLAAQELGDDYDEGFMMDSDGCVIEGTMSNLFAVIDDALVTPELARCGIEGVMRAQVIDIAATQAMKLEIRNIPRDELVSADEVFVSNSLIGLCAVRQIDQHAFSAGRMMQTINAHLQQRMQADAKAAA